MKDTEQKLKNLRRKKLFSMIGLSTWTDKDIADMQLLNVRAFQEDRANERKWRDKIKKRKELNESV